ncbi:MAG: neutral/alkaline non-lysosomal ceramidase N-terminal domain-containing protein [Myxococcales bacterium]
MPELKPRRSSRALVVVYTLGMLYVLFSLDWRGRRPLPEPKVVAQAAAVAEQWRAGAAKVEMDAALPATVAGYPPPRPTAKTSGPLSARALVLSAGDKSVALISAEVLEIPQRVAQAVRARAKELGLADAAVTATHTHSSFGGYDRNPVAEIGATGSWQQEREDALIARLKEALDKANQALAPAQVRVAQAPLPGILYNRDRDGAPNDDLLTVLAVDDAQGKAVSRLVVFGSHATVVGRDPKALDGDWPGRTMRRLEADGGGVALLLQGAMGDQSSDPPKEGEGEPVDRMGARVAQAAQEALLAAATPAAPSLRWAAVEVGMPRAEAEHAVPGFLSMPAANVLHALAPRKAELRAAARAGALAGDAPWGADVLGVVRVAQEARADAGAGRTAGARLLRAGLRGLRGDGRGREAGDWRGQARLVRPGARRAVRGRHRAGAQSHLRPVAVSAPAPASPRRCRRSRSPPRARGSPSRSRA